jgi:hypothetical protein
MAASLRGLLKVGQLVCSYVLDPLQMQAQQLVTNGTGQCEIHDKTRQLLCTPQDALSVMHITSKTGQRCCQLAL